MKITYAALWIGLSLGIAPLARADVTLPAIFSDHAVLQKSAKVPVWGKADPGEKVTVAVDGAKAETTAGADGKWKLALDLSKTGQGPFVMSVEGKNKLAVNDVVVGEVWVCSGQSNMEFVVKNTDNAQADMAASANPMIRQFKVSNTAVTTPAENCVGKWIVAAPETSGYFTAVGYFFARKLNAEIKEPIGLIHTSWGGSAVEAWMSGPLLDSNPDLKASKERMLADITSYPQRLEEYGKQYAEWETKFSRQDKRVGKPEDFAGVAVDTSTWKKVTLPAPFAKIGLPDSGAVWLRRTVTLPPDMANQYAYVELGQIGQFDEVYWNGQKVHETTVKTGGSSAFRRYALSSQFKAGDNVLAVRVFSPAGNGGFLNDKAPFQVRAISFKGEWLAKVEYEMTPLTAEAKAQQPKVPNKLMDKQHWATCLYNGMINPILTYGIAGAIWYQGETNAGRSYQYRSSFPMMITDWRKQWGQGDFPFYWCQLANYMPKAPQPVESGWAELREAQTMTQSLPNSGQAILIDIGEEGDIHPRNKKDAGERLARIALAKTYGKKDVVYSGPVYDSVKFDGDKAIVHFKEVDGGLVARALPATYQPKSLSPATVPLVRNSPNSELEGFALCGEDKQWKWANARIEGETVVVSSPDVPKPVAVRYAWGNNPTCNLYNKADLPAGPFRTDDFPGVTVDKKW